MLLISPSALGQYAEYLAYLNTSNVINKHLVYGIAHPFLTNLNTSNVINKLCSPISTSNNFSFKYIKCY